MKIICRKPSGRYCIAKEKKFPIVEKIFLPFPLVSVSETSSTPFARSARPRKYLSPLGTVPKAESGFKSWMEVSIRGVSPRIPPFCCCSLRRMRSITWSMVVGFWSSATSGIAPSTSSRNRPAVFNLRMTPPNLVGQAEFNPHTCREINQLAVVASRFEFNLLSCSKRGLVQAVAQTADHAVYLHLAGSQEHHIDDDVPFNLRLASLRAVFRTRFVKDVHRGRGAFSGNGFFLGRFRDRRGRIRKARLLYITLSRRSAARRNCSAVAESGTSYGAFDSVGSARAIAIARTGGQRQRTLLIDIGPLVRIAGSGNTVGVAEASRLHFCHRRIYRGGRGAAGRRQVSDSDRIARPHRLIGFDGELGGFKVHRFQFRRLEIHRLGFRRCGKSRPGRKELDGLGLDRRFFHFREHRLYFRLHLRRFGRQRNLGQRRSYRNHFVMHQGIEFLRNKEGQRHKNRHQNALAQKTDAEGIPAGPVVVQYGEPRLDGAAPYRLLP